MPFCHLLCQRKGIIAEHINMPITKRGKACDIFIIKYFALRSKMIKRSLHIDSVSQHDCVSHQPQCTKLIFQAVAISLPYFTFLTMTNCSGDSVAVFPSVQLGQNSEAIVLIINIIKHIQRFIDPLHLDNCLRESGRSFTFQ